MPVTVYNRSVEDHSDHSNNYLIMRPSVLGNPFTEKPLSGVMAIYKVRSRDEAIARYSKWFDLKYSSDRTFRACVDEIYEKYKNGEEVYLECCCKPKECHGDVIAAKLKARLLREMVSNREDETDSNDEKKRKFSVGQLKTSQKPTKETNSEILRIVNKIRPFCPDDLNEEPSVPKLKRKPLCR